MIMLVLMVGDMAGGWFGRRIEERLHGASHVLRFQNRSVGIPRYGQMVDRGGDLPKKAKVRSNHRPGRCQLTLTQIRVIHGRPRRVACPCRIILNIQGTSPSSNTLQPDSHYSCFR